MLTDLSYLQLVRGSVAMRFFSVEMFRKQSESTSINHFSVVSISSAISWFLAHIFFHRSSSVSRLRGDGRSLVYKFNRLLIFCVFGVMLAVLISAGRIVINSLNINVDSALNLSSSSKLDGLTLVLSMSVCNTLMHSQQGD